MVQGAIKPEPALQRARSFATATNGAVAKEAMNIVKGTPFAAEVSGLLEDVAQRSRLEGAGPQAIRGDKTSLSVNQGDQRIHFANDPDFKWVTSEAGPTKLLGTYDLGEKARRREVEVGSVNAMFNTFKPHLKTFTKEPDGRFVRRSYWKLPDGSLLVNSYKTQSTSSIGRLFSKSWKLGKNASGEVLKQHWQTHLVRDGRSIRIPGALGRSILRRADQRARR